MLTDTRPCPRFDLPAPVAEGVRVLGPAEAPVAVIRGRHRFRLLVKAARRRGDEGRRTEGKVVCGLGNGNRGEDVFGVERAVGDGASDRVGAADDGAVVQTGAREEVGIGSAPMTPAFPFETGGAAHFAHDQNQRVVE